VLLSFDDEVWNKSQAFWEHNKNPQFAETLSEKQKKSTLDQEFKCFQWGEDQSVDGDSPARNY